MKRYSSRAIRAAGAKALFVSALTILLQSGVFAGLVVSSNSIDNGYVGPCDLTITGLDSSGQTVLVEEYVDADGSTTISASDVLVRQFQVTDGQVTTIGGQRNVNVPGDEDVTANSQIQMRVVFRGPQDLTQIDGLHLFRVSPVGGGFTPFTASLTVSQKDHGGSGISGTTGQAGAFVAFLAGGFDGEFAGVTACDGTGAYSMNLPPGSYLPLAAKPGFVYDAGSASPVSVSSGAFTTGQNLTLVPGSRTISGTVRDANTPSNGVPALFMHAVSLSGFVSLTYTGENGDYQVDVPAEGCELGFDEWQVATHGHLPSTAQDGTAGNVAGFNIDLTPAPSMIYGSLKTPGDVALPYVSVNATQFGGSSESQGMTDENGNFSLGVDTGSWELHSEPPGYVVQYQTVVVNTTGSAVQQDLVANAVTAYLIGQVRDTSNNPVPNLEIIARDPTQTGGNEINAFAITDASGNFSIGVYGGGGMATKLWTIQVLFNNDGPPAYISTSPEFNVQDGVDITGIVYQVYNVTAHLTGQVLDETDTPVGNISSYATHTTINGVNTGSNVDGSGNFDMSVFAGTWNLGLSNISGLGLIPQELQVTVADGVDQSGLVIRAQHTTATISGTVKDASNQAVAGIRVYGTVNHGGQTYNTSSTTDGSGFYSFSVFSETWTVGLDSTDLAGQGFQPAANQNVFADTGNVTQNFVVQPTGTPAPEIAVEQPAGSGLTDGGSKSFGDVSAGGSSNLVFTIKNLGTADLTGLQVTKDGANSSDFTVDTSGMVTTIAANGSTTFSVTFAPSGITSGTRTAAIHIASNDSDENPFDLTLSGTLSAAASLDPAFGAAGIVTTPIGASNDYGRGVVVQPDGKIILIGHANTGAGDDFAVVRYNANGALDTSFGTGGKVTTPFAGTLDWARAVALQGDGKIVVAGHSGSGSNSDDYAVARYLPNGALDTTFSGDGVVTVDLSGGAGDNALALAIQQDGKIVVAGSYGTGAAAAIVRFNTDGALDTTFSGDGILVTSFGAQEVFTAVALQPDGKIVAAGYVLTSSGLPLVARYSSDGTLDSDFGTAGKVITNTGGSSPVYAVKLQSDGKIVLGGAKSGDFMAVRYDSNGVLDTSFGGTGYVATNLGGSEGASGLVLQANGKIVLAGQSNAGGNYDFALIRYNLDGSLDATFNGTGSVLTPVGSVDDYGACVTLGLDGTIVAGGYSSNGANYDFALVRYLGDPVYPDIAVEQPAGTDLVDGSAIVSFGGIDIGGSVPVTFTIRNLGDGVLSGLVLSLDGPDSTDFSAPPLGATTLVPGASMNFTVTFAPAGGSSGTRTAAVHIDSNDPDENPFDVSLSGQALSTTGDTDSDGLNDWAEFQYAALGFDWQVTQTALVNTLNTGANAAGLYTPSQIQALNVGTPLLQRNPSTGVFTLTIGVQKSIDLIHYDPFPMSAPQTTINGSGLLEFQFTLPGNAAFLQLHSQ